MSFSSLTRRFRKARSKGSEDHDSSNSSRSTPDPHRSTSEAPSSTVAASTLNGEGAGTTNSSLPVPMPTPQPAPVSMPVPQPSEPPPRTPTLTISTAVPNATPRAMDGGLAELTPTARARVEAGPAIKRMDRALDTMGASFCPTYSSDVVLINANASNRRKGRQPRPADEHDPHGVERCGADARAVGRR